jgi:hypothetical protein
MTGAEPRLGDGARVDTGEGSLSCASSQIDGEVGDWQREYTASKDS